MAAGCSKENPEIVAFVGDSITKRWDLPTYFSTKTVHNYGKSGARLDHLKTYSGALRDMTAVVLIGTNDNLNWDGKYMEQYEEYVLGLLAKRVIIVSILPRRTDDDRADINTEISKLNEELQEMSARRNWDYVNAFPLFLKDGCINPEYYLDGLHLTYCGYEVLSNEIKKVL